MNFFGITLRPMFIFGLVLLVLGLAPQDSLAQTPALTASPSSLSFGIPTGSPGGVSAPQTVTVNIPSGSATFNSVSAASPFSVTGNSCIGSITGPTTCEVSVTLTTLSSALQTANLVISYDIESSLTVPLSGAYGAIKLFDSTTVQNSFSGTSFTNLYTIGSSSLNLSCPATPKAKLSSTPDGSANVLVDNYIVLGINGTPVQTYLDNSTNDFSVTYTNNGQPLAYPLGNVCKGSDASPDTFGVNTYPECFSSSYRSNVSNYLSQNTDLFVSTGGVPALDVSIFLDQVQGDQTLPFPVQTSVSLLDAGGFIASSSLFLITDCSPAGIVPGGSITGNPITPGVPQTFTFDSAPGQNISLTSTNTGTGAVPIVTDIGIPQSQFSQLVVGTSAAPAVCLRLAGELDPSGNPMCKAFLIQCYNPNDGTTTGDNCVPSLSPSRNLLDQAQYTSPDAPAPTSSDPSQNFLSPSSPVNACRNLSSPSQSVVCAAGTGPGMLLGGDGWLADPLSQSNCALTGTLAGYLCPLDTLTQFNGAADPRTGSTTTGKNSIFIPVVNVPLPTTVTTTNANANSWVNSAAINATFVSNQASYNPTPSNPGGNGFTAAPPYSVTYGLTPASVPLPDTTFPVVTDTTKYADGTSTTGGNITPPINISSCSSQPVTTFTTTDSFSPGDGIYNLHYFTTDCAFTEGLVFNPTSGQLTDPTANWASFPYSTVGVDTAAPTFACSATPSTGSWYNSNQTVQCTVTDQNYVAGASGSGFLPLLANSIQGSPSEMVSVSTNVTSGAVNSAAPTSTVPGCDLAGNCVNVSGGPFKIDLQNPTITGPTLTPAASGNIYYVGGPAVTVSYSCSDGAGSGIATCSGPLASGSTIDTSAAAVGPHTFTVTSTDIAGNQSTASVTYTVAGASPADLWLTEVPITSDSIKRGTTGSFYAAVVNLSSPTASNVVVTTTFSAPSGVLGHLSAGYALVTCNLTGCTSLPNSTTACAVSGTIITCNVGQLPSVLASKYGVVVKINIPVSATAPLNTPFYSVSTVTSANDPRSSNNSYTEKYTVSR